MARPIEHDHSMCPECHQPTSYYDGHFRANKCTNPTCTFHEPVEQPQKMTKWDIIDLLNNDEDVGNAVLAFLDKKFQEAKNELEATTEST